MSVTGCQLTSSALVILVGIACVWLVSPQSGSAADKAPPAIKSRVMTLKEVSQNKAAWGEMRPYFTGETIGTDRVLAASGTILPGKAVHGAHRHAEEEYLLITDGSGTWYLDGKTFPAVKGDLLYVEPWVYHGIRNTSDKPLSFVVIKYNNKGSKPPAHPDDGKPDELSE